MEALVNEREERHAKALGDSHTPIEPAWYRHSDFLSLFFNASSVAIPEAERSVVLTAQAFAAHYDIPLLWPKIENIIHEETAHSRVHDAYNRYLASTGLPVARHIAASKRLVAVFRSFSLKNRLAICATIEHFTATSARHILDNGIFEGRDIDDRLDRVWTWHALEELDHRSTIFDLYTAAGGGYFRRIGGVVVATSLFLYGHHVCFVSFLRARGILWDRRAWREGWPLLFGKRGIYRSMFWDWLLLFRPGFHPDDIAISNRLQRQLHHYHIEDELIGYFEAATA